VEKLRNKAKEMARRPGSATQSVRGSLMQCLVECFLLKGDQDRAEGVLNLALLER
jgi:hypothetical protein